MFIKQNFAVLFACVCTLRFFEQEANEIGTYTHSLIFNLLKFIAKRMIDAT